MYGAGGRALDLIKQYPGRFISMHVKDEIKSANGGGHWRDTKARFLELASSR